MTTLDEFKAKLRNGYPWLSDRFITRQAEHDKLAVDHRARVAGLIEITTDPDRALKLWQRASSEQSTMWGQLTVFKNMLVAAGLVDRDQLEL